MAVEIEAKWIAPDLALVRELLRTAGAVLVHAERMTYRKTFDYPNKQLAGRGGWVRVRYDGEHTELTYKQLRDRSMRGMVEVTVGVSDFAQACVFLEAIGLVTKSYQETKREIWQMGGCEVALDSWPWIPPVVELEGPSETAIQQVAGQLGFEWSQAMYGSIENVYAKCYDVTEQEVIGWPEITFSLVPDWLEAKRKS